jgi:hypothetical protein
MIHSITGDGVTYLDDLVLVLWEIESFGSTFKRLSPILHHPTRFIRQLFATLFKSDNFSLQSGHFLRSSQSSYSL